MNNKYCRICWNTNGWQKPSGAAVESESYFATNGFGHEEWLFNYEWCLNGEKYAFLQPINKYRDTFEQQSFAAALYTKVENRTLLVATIDSVYVPSLKELTEAYTKMSERGWIDQMRQDVTSVGGKLADLNSPAPHLILNVRFNPKNVSLFNPMRVFPEDHKVARTFRYQAIDWDDQKIPAYDHASSPHDDDPTRSELQRLRAAQQATTIDPKHVRLQNRLYRALCKTYGNDAVGYEQDFVDLRTITPVGC